MDKGNQGLRSELQRVRNCKILQINTGQTNKNNIVSRPTLQILNQ